MATTTARFDINEPIRKLLHELSADGRLVKADLVGFGPLEEGGSPSFALVITGSKGEVLAEALVRYLQGLAMQAQREEPPG